MTLQYRCEVDIRECNGLLRGKLILKHRGFGRRSVLGGLLRASSAAICPLSIVASTVRRCWPCRSVEDVEVYIVHPLGLPTLDRFPQFSAIAREYPSMDIRVMPKTAEIDQSWPLFLLPTSAIALFPYPRQSTERTRSLDLSPQAKR